MSASLNAAILELVRETTRRVILPRYQNLAAHEVFEKAADDLVTVADREAEEMLSDGLARIDPSLAIVGEEAVAADPAVLERLTGQCWIIDPIDGTANFAAGKPPFGILIARCDARRAMSGWIYDCLTGRFCAAHRGGGAFVNDEQIAARTTGLSPPVAGLSKLFITPEQAAWVEAHIEPHFQLVEIPRCAAEQYPRLALGQNDVSNYNRTLPWDHAAGALWLNEAGGMAARFDGGEYFVDEHARPGLLAASTPAMWEAYMAIIRPLIKARSPTSP